MKNFTTEEVHSIVVNVFQDLMELINQNPDRNVKTMIIMFLSKTIKALAEKDPDVYKIETNNPIIDFALVASKIVEEVASDVNNGKKAKRNGYFLPEDVIGLVNIATDRLIEVYQKKVSIHEPQINAIETLRKRILGFIEHYTNETTYNKNQEYNPVNEKEIPPSEHSSTLTFEENDGENAVDESKTDGGGFWEH